MRVTRRYRFAASHRLHSPRLSEEQNQETYGKCNNPYGHGHDYILEVTLQGPADQQTGLVMNREDFDGFVDRTVLQELRHSNLNTQIPVFAESVPTTENVAVEIRRRLADQWREAFPANGPRLERIRLYETRKNIIEVSGQ